MSKKYSIIISTKKRVENLRLLSATSKQQISKRLRSANVTRNIQSAYPGSRLSRNIGTVFPQSNEFNQPTVKQTVQREIDNFLNDSRIAESSQYL